MIVATGRRMTACASRAQPTPVGPWRNPGSGIRSALTRGPRIASRAGRTVSAPTAATSTAAVPPRPIERRKICGKITRLDRLSAMIVPETSTDRPAVAMVRDIASAVS